MQASVHVTSKTQGEGNHADFGVAGSASAASMPRRHWQRRVVSFLHRLALCGVATSAFMATGVAVWVHENYVIDAMNSGELSPARGLASMALGAIPLVIYGAIFWLARETCIELDRVDMRQSHLGNSSYAEGYRSTSSNKEIPLTDGSGCYRVANGNVQSTPHAKAPTALQCTVATSEKTHTTQLTT